MSTVVYVKPGCPYCEEARTSLRADGVEFEERDATTRPDWRAELMEHSRGHRDGPDRRPRRRGRDRRLEGPRLTRAVSGRSGR